MQFIWNETMTSGAKITMEHVKMSILRDCLDLKSASFEFDCQFSFRILINIYTCINYYHLSTKTNKNVNILNLGTNLLHYEFSDYAFHVLLTIFINAMDESLWLRGCGLCALNWF